MQYADLSLLTFISHSVFAVGLPLFLFNVLNEQSGQVFSNKMCFLSPHSIEHLNSNFFTAIKRCDQKQNTELFQLKSFVKEIISLFWHFC